ncbi:hypothetical protein K523DRAFT_11188 [Schizophyllum commune Tattone D]|nr:hypothetical protein K523DRAFT_11188 [Schizophyllum commune Tattone D]
MRPTTTRRSESFRPAFPSCLAGINYPICMYFTIFSPRYQGNPSDPSDPNPRKYNGGSGAQRLSQREMSDGGRTPTRRC